MSSSLLIAAIASREAIRRLSIGVHPHAIQQLSLSEASSYCRSERPDLLILEVHSRWTQADVQAARETLAELTNTERRRMKILLFASSPLVFRLAGDLLFVDDVHTTPTGFIDAFVIQPPLGSRGVASVEEQVHSCIEALLTLEDQRLPALGDSSWTPTLAGPESFDLWFRWLPRYARYLNENPLILGETGTGKTRLAAAIHALSGRTGPFVSITPRDFSSVELVQAELFGAVAGAYTGAVDKWGLVKKAEGGTLFIDELQSIDVELQGKLITFIEDKKYRRVGAAEQHSADVRFIFASNRPLDELVHTGKLRDDFAYRLERLQLKLQPLRERPLDIAAAICWALATIHRVRPQRSIAVEGLSEDSYRRLFAARWPGNIRQLESVLAQAVETAVLQNNSCIEESVVLRTLDNSLGGHHARSEEIIARATEAVLAIIRGGGQITAVEASSLLLVKAREFALETSAGDTERAAALLGDDANLLNWLQEVER